MAEATLELRSLLDSAERAASVQDFASAEQYLRQAAFLQEAQLGPHHPDLANTLNNLGIVCERTGKSADAEACYRRAYAIARSTLPAEDPLVLTSGQNLKDFCAATGLPFEPVATPPPPSAPTPVPPAPAPPAPAPPAAAPLAPAPPAPLASLRGPSAPAPAVGAPAVPTPTASAPTAPSPDPFPLRAPAAPSSPARVERENRPAPHAINVTPVAVPVDPKAILRHRSAKWVVIGSGLMLTFVLALANWSSRSSEPAAPVATPETPRAEAPPSEPPPAPAASAAPKASATPAPPQRSTPGDAVKKPAAANTPSTAARAASTRASLVESQLCRSLNNWRCTPATNPAEPGAFIFYTRVKSARDTTVQHRWYLGGTLRRSVDLRVAANPGDGYRTYSRNSVGADRRGNWTIEVRDADGALLHEERFVVQ